MPAVATDSYLETHVRTAAPHQLHLMVIEGAVRFAESAAEAIVNRERQRAHVLLNRSRECINELLAGLNPEADADLVDRLKQLFLFAHRELVRADLEQDPQRVEHALRVLRAHRETWRELTERLPRESNGAGQEPRSWLT